MRSHVRSVPMAVLAMLAFAVALSASPVTPEAPAETTRAEAALPEGLSPGWYARIDTSMGTIVAKLLPEQAPQTVAHFAALAEGRLPWVDPFTGEEVTRPFYDGLLVHAAKANHSFETGDPTGTGRGPSPYYLPPEGFGPVNFRTGFRLGMNRVGPTRISASQFFVTAWGLPSLNGKLPCFGEVVAGRDVVRSICGVATRPGGKPLEPVVVEGVRIEAVGEPAPLPEPVPYEPPPSRGFRPQLRPGVR